MADNNSGYPWKFHRLGGLDQVTLQTADDFRHLGELDPKLWVALSCPASGLELDERTMALIDTDNNGRIRVPEVIEAVKWLSDRLADPSTIAHPPTAFPLSYIRSDTKEGQRLLATGREILKDLGRDAENGVITQEEIMEASAKSSSQLFNGDGILPADPELGADLQGFIEDGLALVGGATGVDSRPGLNLELAEAFVKALKAWRDWHQNLNVVDMPLPAKETTEAWSLMEKLADKIDDYFLRTELAAFAPNSSEALNPDFNEHGVDLSTLKDLPLAWVEPDRPLSHDCGINPAWRRQLDRYLELVSPLLAKPGEMNRNDWPKVKKDFSAYSQAMGSRPVPPTTNAAVSPTKTFEEMDEDRIEEILSGNLWEKFQETVKRDINSPESDVEVAALERVILYHRHLYYLLMNFVSFYDFYTSGRQAAFQAGVLHIDGRDCALCLPVGDVEKHSAMSAHSHLCLIYCQCRRVKKPGQDGPDEMMYIVAAVTDGDSDYLMEGRNGVFVDNHGHDWDATIVKFMSNTIGLRQAIWDPYKRISRLIGDQINKLASNSDEKLINTASQTLTKMSAAAPVPAVSLPKPFDIGKSVGIFAAIGLALGALGTALASIARALFSLHWWQFPLLVLGIFLLISGPSVILAWLRLRKRTLGPMLDASGWAINSQVPINLMLGSELTATAKLPPNATRSYNDPLQPPKKRWPITLAAIFIMVAAAALGWYLFDNLKGYFTSTPPAAVSEPAPTTEAAPSAGDQTAEPAPAAETAPPAGEQPVEAAPATETAPPATPAPAEAQPPAAEAEPAPTS